MLTCVSWFAAWRKIFGVFQFPPTMAEWFVTGKKSPSRDTSSLTQEHPPGKRGRRNRPTTVEVCEALQFIPILFTGRQTRICQSTLLWLRQLDKKAENIQNNLIFVYADTQTAVGAGWHCGLQLWKPGSRKAGGTLTALVTNDCHSCKKKNLHSWYKKPAENKQARLQTLEAVFNTPRRSKERARALFFFFLTGCL